MLKGTVMSSSDAINTPEVRIKLPWSVVAVGLFGVLTVIYTTQASVGKLTTEFAELKIAVQQSNSAVASLQTDVNVLKIRTDFNERRLDAGNVGNIGYLPNKTAK